jgi:hypothetical protein
MIADLGFVQQAARVRVDHKIRVDGSRERP